MKKFLTIALLCGLVGMPAFADDNEEFYFADADDNEVFYVGDKSYRCGDWHGDFAFEYNSRVQVLGNSTFESEEMGMNRSYLCQGGGGLRMYDDYWEAEETNWCDASPIKENSVPNADYCIYDEDGEMQECLSQNDDAVVYRYGCIYAECVEGYQWDGSDCVSE